MGAGKLKVSEAKVAAERLQAWLDRPQPYGAADEVRLEPDDLALVLKHYAKLTKPKVSAKGRYVKGRSYEWELRDHFTKHGIECRRVAQSGGGEEKDDIVLITGWGEQYRLEAKRVAKLPAYLINPQCDATVFRQDRGDSLVLVSLQKFTDHIQCR